MAAIIGYLMPTGELTGSLESTGELVGEITKPTGGSPYTGDYEVVPREELIRLLTNGLTMTDDLIIDAIPEDYVGSAVPRQSALSVSGNAITAPAGFYAEDLTETVQTGIEGIPTAVKGAVSNNSIEITPKVRNHEGYIPGSTLEGIPVSVSAGDLVSGTKTITSNVNSSNVTNYRYVRVDVQPNLQTKQYTPTETATTIQADADHDGLSAVEVAGIPSDYVGSGVSRRSSLQVAGATVTAPEGYYSDEVTASVTQATPGVPAIQMSAVSNHAVTLTPKVTNPEGYITAGTTTGTPVSVSAGDLVSGTRSFTANTTSADVTNYEYVDVNVPPVGYDVPTFTITIGVITCDKTFAEAKALADYGLTAALVISPLTAVAYNVFEKDSSHITYEYIDRGEIYHLTYYSNDTITWDSDLVSRDSSDLTASGATVDVPAGWYLSAASKSVSTASHPAPGLTVNTTTGLITATHTQSSGYVTAGTTTTTTQLTTVAGTTITPTTVEQTVVSANRFTLGAVKVAKIPSEYLIPSGTLQITANTTSQDVTNYKYVDVSVSGGGGGKNVQVQHGTKRVAATAYTDVGYEITVAKAGTYNIYWAGWRSSTSGTNGAQVYVNGVASGSAVTTFDGTWTNVQNGSRTSVSLSQGDKVTLRARSRGTSYYMYIFFLSIEEV